MTANFQRFFTLLVVLSLAWTGASHLLPTARAQDGDTLTYNDPAIVTLSAGQTITRTFPVLAGDSFELKLSPLAGFTFSAVLIDPNQTATALTPGPDGAIAYRLDNAALGGTYALALQASSGQGDLLVQLIGDVVEPMPLPQGQTTVDLTGSAQRFSLEPPPEITDPWLFSAMIPAPPDAPLPDVPAPAPNLPALTLVHRDTGAAVFSLAPDALPYVQATLPPQTPYLLTLEPGAAPLQVLITWQPLPDESMSTDSTESMQPNTTSSTGSSTSSSSSSGACEVAFSGAVNLRSGPGLEYDPPLSTVPAGSTLPVTGKNTTGTWWQVNYNGTVGWVSGLVPATQVQGDCGAVPVASGTGASSPTYTPSYTYTPGGPTLTYTPTTDGPTYTYTPSYTPTLDGPTYTYTPSYTPSMTYTPGGPTLTYTPSYTPTTEQPVYTPTYTYTPTQEMVAPTVTYTPSYTPTTPPAAQLAPSDANFNAPLNIPLDNTASVLDFVSYPQGDTEDRVRFDITGMNPNVSLSGGKARLVIAASCFGEGTDQVTFFTGGQTFYCGQTLVDREVTADSRTGQVTITAVGGEGTYVQWVLTGTATRTN
ncbi:MAG: SH3 domain-containing protein [Anaerolineae bacterium]|nr:SH3 domain-containing protein [Anaerolineae bacterium]